MSKTRHILETIIFSITWIIIYIAFSIVFFNTSKDNVNDNLNNTMQVISNIVDVNNYEDSTDNVIVYYKDNDKYRVSIIEYEDSTFKIKKDSLNLLDLNLSECKELQENNLDKYITRKSQYGYNMIYLAHRIENTNHYLRVSIKESLALQVSRNLLIYGSIVIIVTISIYVVFKIIEYNKSIKPLQNQMKRLITLSEDESLVYKNEDIDDLKKISSCIDTLSLSINQKLNQLKIEKEKTDLILNSMTQGFIVLNNEGEIILFNKSAGNIFQYDCKQALNKSYSILLLGNEFDSYIKKLINKELNETYLDINIKGLIYRINMKSFEIESDNKLLGIVILIEDITKEKNIMKIKADFFANASHELKSPLTGILGYQELLLNDYFQTDEERKDAIEKTINEAKRMNSLLIDMLALSKLEENNNTKNLSNLNLKNIILESLNIYENQIKQMNLKINLDLNDIIVLADKDDLLRLFNNLIENAIKYNKKGHFISIKMDNNKKIVEIEDGGIGIKNENISRIFERFYRVDNSRLKSNISGTGLGLAIVKHICQIYNYKISVSSIYGKGTKFSIIFD